MKFCIVLFSLAVHSTYSFQQRISHGHRERKGSSINRRHGWHLQQSTSVQTIRRPLPTVPKERTKRFVDEDYQTYTNVSARSGSRLSSTIECKQKQLPFHTRVAKASLEEIVPWLATMVLAILPCILFDKPDLLYYFLSAEAAFGMFSTWKLLGKLNKPKTPEPLINREWEDVARKVWASQEDLESSRSYLMGWFYDSPYKYLRHEDALSYVAWQRFGVPLGTGVLTENEISELLKFDMPLLLQNVNGGLPLPKRGKNEEPLPMMSFNCEPLRYRHKPMIFYAATHGMSYLTHKALTKTGFQYVAAKDPEHDLSYWYYLPSATSDGVAHDDADPVVFVHGVGGLASCYQMVEEMKQATENDNVPIVCIDLPHVSLKWTGDTPKIESQVASITKILDDIPRNKGYVDSNSPRKATFVGHSYGTAVVSWMIQSHPDRVNGCIFIDPICFQLHLKKILFNFHMQRVDYKIQSTQKWGNPFKFESLINLAGTEMHTNYSMLRQFSWATNSLWPEDLEVLNVPSTVILSENDDIVPVKDVERLISRSQSPLITTHTFQEANHGEMMFDETLRSETVGKIIDVMRTAKSQPQSKIKPQKNPEQSPWTAGFRRVMYAAA